MSPTHPFTIIQPTINRQYPAALALIDSLLTKLKRLDDKMILTEVHLESRVYRGIGNLAKAKVRLSLLLAIFLFNFYLTCARKPADLPHLTFSLACMLIARRRQLTSNLP